MQCVRSETLDIGQRTLLERIARGVPLDDVLEQIVRLVESQADNMLCSIVLLDREHGCIHPGAAPSLPAAYTQALEGLPIGYEAGSCGAAAARAERVIVTDVMTHPYWRAYRHLAAAHGLRACWSTPILSPDHEVLGTFAMYYRVPRGPVDAELDWVDVATHLASIAIMRERKERTLREREQRLRLLHETVGDIIFFLGVESEQSFRFLSVNPAFARTTGLKADAVVGKTFEEVIPEPLRVHVLSKYRQALETRSSVSWDDAATLPTGLMHGEITLTPIIDERGACTHLVGTVHDVTARKQAERERRQLQAQLDQSQRLQALGTLAGAIAHDFNNILVAIVGNTALALAAARDAHLDAAPLEEVASASERAVALVRQILTFSQRHAPEREVLALGPLVEEAARLLRVGLPAGLKVQTHIADDVPAIYADATQMHQIVMNLGTNARRAMAGRSGKITVRVERESLGATHGARAPGERPLDLADGVYARLCVEDQGRGMDKATLDRIFEPFFTTKTTGQGCGLGLSVVHGIVTQHAGTISVKSEEGHGTRFCIWLPATTRSSGRRLAQAAIAPRSEKPHILLLAEDEAMVMLATLMSQRLGYRMTVSSSAAEALAAIRAQPESYDAVLSDVSLLQLSNADALAAIRRIRSDVPMAMITTSVTPSTRAVASQVHVQLAPKPRSLEDFASITRELLTQRGPRA